MEAVLHWLSNNGSLWKARFNLGSLLGLVLVQCNKTSGCANGHSNGKTPNFDLLHLQNHLIFDGAWKRSKVKVTGLLLLLLSLQNLYSAQIQACLSREALCTWRGYTYQYNCLCFLVCHSLYLLHFSALVARAIRQTAETEKLWPAKY